MVGEANLEFPIDQSHTPTKIEIPIRNGNLKSWFFSSGSISPKFLSITQKNPFSGFEGENPYNHLRSFEQLCSTHSCSDLSPGEFRVRLFPFSLAGKQKLGTSIKRRKSPQIGEICVTSSALSTSPYLVS
jgi:hypothetical protein